MPIETSASPIMDDLVDIKGNINSTEALLDKLCPDKVSTKK
jgi:hypothetical protein